MTERSLDILFRKAVLLSWGGACVFCGNGNQDQLEAHHIIKRRKKVLKWDIKNGLPLCNSLSANKCHIAADSKKGEAKIRSIIGEETWNYLCDLEDVTIKDIVIKSGMSSAEFRLDRAKELKRIIKEKCWED